MGHSVHFSKNWVVTQKLLIVKRNGPKSGPPGVYVTCMLVFKVSWGSFGALFQKLGGNSKTAHHRVKRTKNLGPGGVCVTCMLVFLTLNMSRSSGVIPCTFLKIGP